MDIQAVVMDTANQLHKLSKLSKFKAVHQVVGLMLGDHHKVLVDQTHGHNKVVAAVDGNKVDQAMLGLQPVVQDGIKLFEKKKPKRMDKYLKTKKQKI